MKGLTSIFSCLFFILCYSQNENDSLKNNIEVVDSIKQKEKLTFSDKTTADHSYKKAVLFSSLLPGLGQVYNSIGHPYGKQSYWNYF